VKTFACCLLTAIMALTPLVRAAAETSPLELSLAIDRGLAFLQRQQRPDGSFEASGPPNAMSGLAILCFLASGHMPEMGRYGLTVRSALTHLLSTADKEGYFGGDGGDMYSHCIAIIALAEIHGTELNPTQRLQVRAALEKGLAIIYAAQDINKDPGSAGGWRYKPTATDSDLSVTGWCMLALWSCRNAGMPVPRQRLDRAMQYLLRCYRPDHKGFAYTPGAEPSPAMTAVGVLLLHLLDAAHRPEAAAAAKYLVDHPVRDGTRYYYYSLYHTTQAAAQAYDRAWSAVWKNNRELLLGAQRPDDGSWPPVGGEPGAGQDDRAGRFYSTAMSVLTLSVPRRLLPMYQR
jgi:hypothetical protein